MNFIADALTFFRFPAAVAIFAAILTDHWLLAMIVLILAILSDALDGIAARRWPPNDRWYRKDSHVFDNAGDLTLFVGTIAALAVQVQPLWIVITVIAVVGSIPIEIFKAKLRPLFAERVDVFHGWCFGALLAAMLVQVTILATSGFATVTLVWVYFAVTIVIVVRKWDRMTSRPEVSYSGTW